MHIKFKVHYNHYRHIHTWIGICQVQGPSVQALVFQGHWCQCWSESRPCQIPAPTGSWRSGHHLC